MKPIAIALKDLTRSFRSAFALVFMFGIPLLVTGMFHFMFGGAATGDGDFQLPPTGVVIANLDRGDPLAGEAGQAILEALQSEDLAALVDVSLAASPQAARQRVDAGEAAVAVIIPEDFSASFAAVGDVAEIELYSDPAQTIGPAVVETLLRQLADQLSGAKITAAVAVQKASGSVIDPAQIEAIVQSYLAAAPAGDPGSALIEHRTPAAAGEDSPLRGMIGTIMGSMMVFFAFFTGVNTASSILTEHEEGTLPRLFTTPTAQAEVLGGKFLAVGLTVAVQVVTLLVAARLLFGIDWGALPAVALSAAAAICSAAAFGILICSMLRDARQGGVVFGVVLSVTGMLGMMDVFTGNGGAAPTGFVPLLTPQGWAIRSLFLSMNGAPLAGVLPYALVLLALGLGFFVLGALRFQKRYA